MRSFLAAGVVAATLLTGATVAAAHTELIDADPLPGDTVAAVDGIRLLFAGEFLPAEGVEVTLERRSDGALVELGTPETPSGSAILVDVLDELPGPGDYAVRWQTVAADEGFRQPGGYAFTFDPDARPDGADRGGGLMAAGVGLVLAGVALAAVGLVVRGRRTARPTP